MHFLALCVLTLVAAPKTAPMTPPFEPDDDIPVRRMFNAPPEGPQARTTSGHHATLTVEAAPTDDRAHEVGSTFHIILDVPAATAATIEILPDGYAGQLELSKIPKDFTRQLLKQKNVHAMAIPALSGPGTMVYMAFDQPVRRATLKHDTNRLDITLGTADVNETLGRHIVEHIPPPDVAGDDTKRFASAESMMEQRSFVAARREFEGLANNYALKPWVMLRLADMTYLEKGEDTACDLYQKVATEYDTRAAGIEASLRMFVLDCAHQQQALIWTALLSRTNTDNAVGRWIATEARWALQYIHDPVQLQQALRWGEKLLGKPLWNNLLARLVRTGTPLAVAEASRRYGPALRAHHDSADLAVWVANSFCSLDLTREAARAAEGAHKTAWLASAVRCSQVKPFEPPTTFRDVEDMKKRLSQIKQRTRDVQDAIAALEAEEAAQPKEAP